MRFLRIRIEDINIPVKVKKKITELVGEIEINAIRECLQNCV